MNIISNLSISNVTYMKKYGFRVNNINGMNGMDDYTIVLLLCFSSIVLIYMTRFIKPEPDDEDEDIKKKYQPARKRNISIDPYSVFLSPMSPFLSPVYINSRDKKYIFDTHIQI